MIKAYLKRVLLFLPVLLCYFLVLGLSMLGVIMYASQFLFDDKGSTDSLVSVACYVPDDDTYTRLGLGLAMKMDSVKHTAELNIVSSKKEVVRLVEDQDAVAGIIVPEGFIENLGTENALQVSIIYRNADTFEEHLVNDLVYALSDFLGTTQCTILTARDYASLQGMDTYEAYDIGNSVMNNCYQYIMDRKSLFHKIDADDLVAKYAVRERMTASYTLYIMMMSIFVISFFFKGNSDIFKARAKLSGIRTWKLFLIEAGSASLMIYFLYLLMYICLFAIFDTMKILALFTVIPFIILIALAGTALCYIVKSPSTVSYITFGAGTGLMYLAGGLMPLDYMPHFFQLAAVYNPVHYLIVFFMRAMFL